MASRGEIYSTGESELRCARTSLAGGEGGEEDVALVRSWAVPLRRHAKKRPRGLRPDVYSDPFFSAMSRLMELTELNQLVRQHELLLLQLLEQVAIFPHLIP